MLKEIFEQANTIDYAINQNINKIKKITNKIKKTKDIFLIGCGTSYNCCLYASYLFRDLLNKQTIPIIASEFDNYLPLITKKSLIIAVSQSGETIDVLEAVKKAKEKKATVFSIVNTDFSTLTRISDENIMMNAGPEICVLSTKSYTSQIAIFLLLIYSLKYNYVDAIKKIKKISNKITTILEKNFNSIKKIADLIKEKNNLFIIGRNSLYPIALEGALKIKEVSYIHAEGFAGGELKHGTIALIEKKTPVIILCSKKQKELTLSNAIEIKSRGGYIIGFDCVNNEIFDNFIEIPNTSEDYSILMIIPIQILSYFLAINRGCDPDKPRNLAKSVTVV